MGGGSPGRPFSAVQRSKNQAPGEEFGLPETPLSSEAVRGMYLDCAVEISKTSGPTKTDLSELPRRASHPDAASETHLRAADSRDRLATYSSSSRSEECKDLLAPFAEREYVDVKRAAKILGVSQTTVLELCGSIGGRPPRLDCINWAPNKRKRIRYQSIVDFCDALRKRYAIADRRPPLTNPIFRHRDADLLPFPLDDTIYVEDAMKILGYISAWPVYKLIEEGAFEAYLLSVRIRWRISRTSFAAFIKRPATVAGGPDHER